MEGRGVAHMGVGHGEGEDKIEQAIQTAIHSPLLETSISGAKSILLYVTGGYDMGMLDINTIAEKVQTEADPDANIIFGAAISEEMNEKISVTIIATDFGNVKGSGMGGSAVADAPVEAPARGTSNLPRVTIDGLEGFEADLDSLLGDNGQAETSGTDFDIPDFLR
jgi:cell division protein FtsZ